MLAQQDRDDLRIGHAQAHASAERELELRQKEYEYYRNLLLNFPKSEEVAA